MQTSKAIVWAKEYNLYCEHSKEVRKNQKSKTVIPSPVLFLPIV